MDRRYRTPQDLIEALQARDPAARARLWELLRAPVARLMAEFSARHALNEDQELLTRHALHSADTYLRTRPPEEFRGAGWAAFQGAVLLQVAKVAFQPFGRARPGALAGPDALPESPTYHAEALFLPYARLGKHWFGGDWYGGREGPDGSLWVIVADITGHGYYAYLLACGLPGVWQRCWAGLPDGAEPADVLAAMHDFLLDCLPEGFFVECTLVRLGPDGRVTVAPAGGTRLLLRRGAGRPDLLKLRGTWLGLSPPSFDDQQSWELGHGDELLVATDGVFDHLADPTDPDDLPRAAAALGEGALFDSIRARLDQALAQGPQRDDITMILLRRRAGANGPEGAGDVPV